MTKDDAPPSLDVETCVTDTLREYCACFNERRFTDAVGLFAPGATPRGYSCARGFTASK